MATLLLATYLLAVVLSPLAASGSPPSSIRAAVVQVGGCSGVCVDPGGLIMTAKHCDLSEIEIVTVGTQRFVAVRVFEAAGTEGPLVYDCLGSGFDWIPVASTQPHAGDVVWTMGFPAIDGTRSYRELRGIVEGGTKARYRGEEFLGNIASMEITEGWSGGPLLNAEGEVIGLANSSGVGVGSIFISYAATREAYEAARVLHASRPTLQVLLQPHEAESLAFQEDFASDLEFQRELREHFRLVFLDGRTAHPPLARYASSPAPVFVLADGQAVSGYRGPVDLIKRLLQARQASGPLPWDEW